ncbi:MAG: hypothetical protein KJ674_04110 [Nanoarchaeota archaeon]|nr:hypothetical protein [Nanoarchaeota archaeon]
MGFIQFEVKVKDGKSDVKLNWEETELEEFGIALFKLELIKKTLLEQAEKLIIKESS